MRFSTRAGYGLRAVVNLAKIYPNQKSLNSIAKEEAISEKYLEQIFRNLRKNNIIKSQKGREGGYILSKAPKNLTAGQVIESLDGPFMPINCSSNINECENCDCSSNIVWQKVQKQIKKTLYSIKLKDLIKQ